MTIPTPFTPYGAARDAVSALLLARSAIPSETPPLTSLLPRPKTGQPGGGRLLSAPSPLRPNTAPPASVIPKKGRFNGVPTLRLEHSQYGGGALHTGSPPRPVRNAHSPTRSGSPPRITKSAGRVRSPPGSISPPRNVRTPDVSSTPHMMRLDGQGRGRRESRLRALIKSDEESIGSLNSGQFLRGEAKSPPPVPIREKRKKPFERRLTVKDKSYEQMTKPCPYGCGTLIPKEREGVLTKHELWVCPLRPTDCGLGCGKQVPFKNVAKHERYVCPNRVVHCSVCNDWSGPFCSLNDHMVTTCGAREVHCVYCGTASTARTLSMHMANCEMRPVMCSACGLEMNAHLLPQHTLNSCPARETLCTLGCGARILARDADEHVREHCPRREVNCRLGCGVVVHTGALDLLSCDDGMVTNKVALAQLCCSSTRSSFAPDEESSAHAVVVRWSKLMTFWFMLTGFRLCVSITPLRARYVSFAF